MPKRSRGERPNRAVPRPFGKRFSDGLAATRLRVAKSVFMLHMSAMAKAQRKSRVRAGPAGGGAKQAITLRLDAASYRRLELLARAENRTPTNYVETAVLRDMEAKEETARVITMFVPEEAANLVPGSLVRTEGESEERYAERSALMNKLFAIPDAG